MTDRITSSFGATSTAREAVAGHDLAGQKAIVTGAASGIGVETARALAEAGADVLIGVRNLEAGQEQGAATSAWAAVGSELEGVGGLYLDNCNQAVPWAESNPFEGVMPHALDPQAAERLWQVSEETTGARL